MVHEAYLRLVGDQDVGWDSRAHFYGAAAEAMRRILIEHARRVGAAKRGGGWKREILSVADLSSDETIGHALDIDAAIEALKMYLAANPERRRDFVSDPGWRLRGLVNEPGYKDLVGAR